MSTLIHIASAEIGVKEIKGISHNPRILDYAKEAGFSWVNDDETPWCSIFMNWCANKAGLKSTGKANARSWLNVGRPEKEPEPGDVVIFWRKSIEGKLGHVGIFMGFSSDANRVYVLGGNQGNQVSITAYHASRILGFRRLTNSENFAYPNKPLRPGDTGQEVIRLQDALKIAGYDCGTSDGSYGPKTKAAVMQLQGTSDKLKDTGFYNSDTVKYLIKLLEE